MSHLHFCSDWIVFSERDCRSRYADYPRLLRSPIPPHEVWARFFASSMKDDLRYTPSDCFETFPFPPNFETDPTLESAGRAYYDFRAALMVRNNEGLTKTYNRFHDPDERSPDILKLRELHAAMDRAVLDAYGWTDLKPTCEFLLDYEEDEDEDEPAEAAAARSPGATAGPTTSATKSSPASWNSTASAPSRSAWRVSPGKVPEQKFGKAPAVAKSLKEKPWNPHRICLPRTPTRSSFQNPDMSGGEMSWLLFLDESGHDHKSMPYEVRGGIALHADAYGRSCRECSGSRSTASAATCTNTAAN